MRPFVPTATSTVLLPEAAQAQAQTIPYELLQNVSHGVGAPGRVELPTNGLGNRCSIHLSYGAK